MSEPLNYFIQFYVSIVAYFILHMIFVISSDFVEAFNIPPLNIGIYVDKLASIRALLMVIADILEWGILQKWAGDYSMDQKLTESITNWPQGVRRLGSIFSFIVMLGCRIAYLRLVYSSDNKSLSVFITLCIEGFWFGVFQMSFFAIGPQYNAATSLGIHTMGNFIFFLQLYMQRRAMSRPQINSLYRVRVHAWICLVTSVVALCCWLYFCICVSASENMAKLAKQLNDANVTNTAKGWTATPGGGLTEYDVWSPFLLFIVGAFAEDFSVPGILPFAFLDTERANLVNYLTPLFFMSGAVITFFLNDIFGGEAGLTGQSSLNSYFKEWSAGVKHGWHGLWAVNVPKYVAFFIAMFGIHGTFGSLRCIVQCRWRVMLLTMFIVIPRAWLETAGYVAVANYALGLFAVTGYGTGDGLTNVTNWEETGEKHKFKLCSQATSTGQCSGSGHVHGWHKEIGSGNYWYLEGANASGFAYIAYHDMLAMFCRFVYGKLAIKYNYINQYDISDIQIYTII